MFAYWRSFLFGWQRYRRREPVTTSALMAGPVPFIKVQFTTRGCAGSSEVITRGIRTLQRLGQEAPTFYGGFVSIELITESAEQVEAITAAFAAAPIPVSALAIPADYRTEHGTQLKARGLHYAVECRRSGWNARDGRTFILHLDEESVMMPGEVRKLISVLTTTTHQVLEGPIYYPLEYLDAHPMCRAMEANRPIGCFECREVMEEGIPLHLHGSNLVIDEAFENDIGWDIGTLDGQALIAEDYVFGLNAYVAHGHRSSAGTAASCSNSRRSRCAAPSNNAIGGSSACCRVWL